MASNTLLTCATRKCPHPAKLRDSVGQLICTRCHWERLRASAKPPENLDRNDRADKRTIFRAEGEDEE